MTDLMKVRTVTELNEALSRASAWRKREISSVHIAIERERDRTRSATLRRAAAPLLYAHWEGFVREAAGRYVEFVSRQRLRYEQLKTCFVVLACVPRLRAGELSERMLPRIQLVDFLLLNQGERARIPFEDVIETKSNLSSRVLRDIFLAVGLDYGEEISSKELLIDGSLLRMRNLVAHGERFLIDEVTYLQLQELVVWLLDAVKDVIENAAVLGQFRR